MSSEEQEPAPVGPSDTQLQQVSDALIKGLVEDLGNAETRTAASAEVARKLLRDNHFELSPASQANLVPITRTLPHGAPEPIPPATRTG